jgi:hypothetical protein
MNNLRKNEDDLLGRYINPDRIEKAPEGFTEKLMARIAVEREPLRIPREIRLIPGISAGVTLMLIIMAIIFSSPAENTILSGVMKYLRNMDLHILQVKMDTISGFNIPSLAFYIVIGFFVLTLFDRAISTLFHGHRQ